MHLSFIVYDLMTHEIYGGICAFYMKAKNWRRKWKKNPLKISCIMWL